MNDRRRLDVPKKWRAFGVILTCIPLAVLSALSAVACFAALVGRGSEGEEGISAVLGLMLAALAVALGSLPVRSASRHLSISRSASVAGVAVVACLWFAATLIVNSAPDVIAGWASLPTLLFWFAFSGYTLPIAAIGFLVLVGSAVVVAHRE